MLEFNCKLSKMWDVFKSKCVGGGLIHNQNRQVFCNVYTFTREEARHQECENARTAAATGVSERFSNKNKC